MASARLQRWALLLVAYEYDLCYRTGSANANADALSRLTLSETVEDEPVPGETIFVMESLNSTPVSFEQIKGWTETDPTLQEVLQYVHNGWREKCSDKNLQPYHNRRTEFSSHLGVLL